MDDKRHRHKETHTIIHVYLRIIAVARNFSFNIFTSHCLRFNEGAYMYWGLFFITFDVNPSIYI